MGRRGPPGGRDTFSGPPFFPSVDGMRDVLMQYTTGVKNSVPGTAGPGYCRNREIN